jgi:tetraacyldisaccharide 4'-kinase
MARARTSIATALEEGSLRGLAAEALARVHAPLAARAIARPLSLPDGVPVVTVGGATLGGSGKTRVATACARALLARGFDVVALVGHAYGASRSSLRARFVAPDDAIDDAGDEAIACARGVARDGLADRIRVVVASARRDAVALAVASGAQAIVIDGPLTTRPRRPALSILAVDRERPWGAGRVAPRGDLRAPPDALLAHADVVVEVGATPSPADVAALRGRRFGLFTAVARPRRIVEGLAREGLVPAVHVRAPDHGPIGPEVRRALEHPRAGGSLAVWVATPKCAVHLAPLRTSAEVYVLDDGLALSDAVVARLPLQGATPEIVGNAPTYVP